MAIVPQILSKKVSFQNTVEEINCDFYPPEISIEDALKTKNIQFIDVREFDEFPKVEALNPIYIPLSEFENNLEKINLEKVTMIFCQAGVRSKAAVSILQKHHINNSYSVKEGASEILEYCCNNPNIFLTSG